MTFSVVARDAGTGRIGLATTSSDIAVGARVMWGRAQVGGVLTQHTTDPRLGIRGLDLLAGGNSASEVIDELVDHAFCAPARQLAVVDAAGGAAAWAGEFVDARAAYTESFDGFAVVGNVLASPRVGAAVADYFAAHADQDLAARLIASLSAGLDAGGECAPLASAAVQVYDAEAFAYVDLRVDQHAEPLTELQRLNGEFAPRRDDYVRRALRPDVGYASAYAPSASTWYEVSPDSADGRKSEPEA